MGPDVRRGLVEHKSDGAIRSEWRRFLIHYCRNESKIEPALSWS